MKDVGFDDELSLTEHLEELRSRVIWIALAVLTGGIISFFFKDHIIHILKMPLPQKYSNLTFLAPSEAFAAVVKVSFFSGLIISSPVVFYQVWRFITPALKSEERKSIMLIVFFSSFLFIIGVLFAYFVILRLALKFLLEYGEGFGISLITFDNYISFITKLMLAFGLTFEFPVVIAILAKLGMLTHHTLSKNRGIWIVAIFIIAAIATPTPDAVTQLLMAAPLMLLFEISIYVARIFESKEKGDVI